MNHNIRKKSVLLTCVSVLFCGSLTAVAADNSKTTLNLETTSVSESSNGYVSSLPSEISYEITFGEIRDDLLEYLEYSGTNIQYGSKEYVDFLNEVSFCPPSDIPENLITYYSAYASVFSEDELSNGMLDKTIQQVRDENICERNEMIADFSQEPEPYYVGNYNTKGALKYAADYALVFNYNYPQYGADCTNFASQILHEGGGLPTTAYWNIWAQEGIAWETWVNAGKFCVYWGDVRGHVGHACGSVSAVNQYSEPGDFLVWRQRDTLEYTHTQFVQSKVNNEIYCTQHSWEYYNLKFSDQVSNSAFNNYSVYQLDFH